MNSKSNGGFPPLKKVNKDIKEPKIKKTKTNTQRMLNIKSILSDSIVKPMIDLTKPSQERIIDTF